ncbi:MAG TPA: hypothetical protein DCM87_09255 [Planctomycetes bacterium]|nr:hypothetical protein [Planctomycetota bacterium]
MTGEGKSRTKVVFPGYTVKERLAEPSRAVLLRARQDALARDVLIKLVPAASPEKVGAVRAEVRLRLALAHDAVAAPIDEGAAGGYRFFVFELPEGDAIESLRASPAPVVLAAARRLFRFLEHAHRSGIFIGSLDPRDVRVTAAGDIRIVNLEHAAAAPQDAGKVPGVVQAPEIRAGKGGPSARGDLYLAGALLHAGIAGGAARAGRAVRRAPNLPAALRAALQRVLADDPAARPESAAAVLAGLESEGAGRDTARWREVLTAPGLAAIAAVAVGAGIAAFWLSLARLHDDAAPGAAGEPPARAEKGGGDAPERPDVSGGVPPDLVRPAEVDAAARAFAKALADDELAREHWQERIAAWEEFVAEHAGTEWAARADARAKELRRDAETDAEKRLGDLVAAAGGHTALLVTRLEEFAEHRRNKGTRAAATARERTGALRTQHLARINGIAARAEELARGGDFAAARDQLGGADEHLLPEGVKVLDAARAAIREVEARWKGEGERWQALEDAARAACEARDFAGAAQRLAAAGGDWVRGDAAAAHAALVRACTYAAQASGAVNAAVRDLHERGADRMFTYRVRGEAGEVHGRIVAVADDGARIEIKRKSRTDRVAIDPLALDLDTLCGWVREHAPGVHAEAALAYQFALLGLSSEAAAAASLAGAQAPPELGAFLDAERERHAARAIETLSGRGAALLAEGRCREALDLYAESVPRLAGSAAMRAARERLRDAYVRAYAGARLGEGAATAFRGKAALDDQGWLTVEYTFTDDVQLQDWRPAGGRGTVATAALGSSMEVRGRVGLHGGERIFAGGVRVEGEAEPLADAPNVGVVVGGPADAYEVLFGLGFEQQEPVADSVLPGPLNLVLVRPRGAEQWHLAFRGYDERIKMQKGRVAYFAAACAEMLELTLQRSTLFRKPAKALADELPAIAGREAPGGVIITTGQSPVVFHRLRIRGLLRREWLQETWARDAAAAFEALAGGAGGAAPPAGSGSAASPGAPGRPEAVR